MATKILGTTFFNVSSTPQRGVAATGDITTDGFDLHDYDQGWVVYITRTLTTGRPRVTIQVSNDDTTYVDYDPRTIDMFIPKSISKSSFKPRFMRLVYTANSATGFVTMFLVRTNSSA